MRLSAVVTVSLAALVSAQDAGAAAPAAPKATTPAGAAGAFPGGLPKMPAAACAASCLQPLLKGDCFAGLKPPSFGAMGKGKGKGPPAAGSATAPGALQRRQGAPAATTPAPALPKISLTPEMQAQLSSAKAAGESARNCFCGGPALKSMMSTCVPSACASAAPTANPADSVAKMVNGMCKGVSGFTPFAAGAAPAKAAGGS